MKIIISRKGLDTTTHTKIKKQNKSKSESFSLGSSPIFKDCMFSLPISDKLQNNNSYSHIKYKEKTYSEIFQKLHGLDLDKCNRGAHLDPDLIYSSKVRKKGWKPNFGQHSKRLSYLREQKVSTGDLFLFFGRYSCIDMKFTDLFENPFMPKFKGKKAFHCFHGWLEIGATENVNKTTVKNWPWLDDHPHIINSEYKDSTKDGENSIFISSDFLALDKTIPGAGVFPKYTQNLCLSDPSGNSDQWLLPSWARNISKPRVLRPLRTEGEFTVMDTRGQWQEAVIDTYNFPEAKDWALDIIKSGLGVE